MKLGPAHRWRGGAGIDVSGVLCGYKEGGVASVGRASVKNGSVCVRDRRVCVRDGHLCVRDGQVFVRDGRVFVRDGLFLR